MNRFESPRVFCPDASGVFVGREATKHLEPADGPLAYRNQILAIGIGWVEDNEAHYDYRIRP